MSIEIERRFLLKNDSWRTQAGAPKVLQQGYFTVEKECAIRVRIVGDDAWLTFKGYISDVSRSEYEYKIPHRDAVEMMRTMCPFKLEKHRYEIEHQGFVFEIDEYFGDNAPLVVVEIELPSEDTEFAKPDWLGEEITSNGKFTNAYLSKHSYSSWKK